TIALHFYFTLSTCLCLSRLSAHVPWQAFVHLSEGQLNGGFGGGALITDRWVLTAGRNLFVNKDREDIPRPILHFPKIYLGIKDRSEANESNEHPVEEVLVHPLFQKLSHWDNDLALIKLQRPVLINEKVTPIPLPDKCQDLSNTTGKSGVITGWGLGALLSPAPHLKHLVLPLVNQSECKSVYDRDPEAPNIDDSMICTGASKFEENVCFGDAGSALAVTDPDSGDVYAAGILSFDKSCRVKPFAVYTKLSAHLPWIQKVTRGDTDQSINVRTAAMSKMISQQL
uniref:Peptidase S1 domain-containing protein n=1 Tax=Salarias fasciatus TaxID=181472 RepID=A0A672FSR7_SALFA